MFLETEFFLLWRDEKGVSPRIYLDSKVTEVRKMMVITFKEKTDLRFAKRVLPTLHGTECLLFYTAIGKYTGEFSPSLSDFSEKLGKVPLESFEFHQIRRDFEKWIMEILGDIYLADKISQIDK